MYVKEFTAECIGKVQIEVQVISFDLKFVCLAIFIVVVSENEIMT